jgi:hypothetical protein
MASRKPKAQPTGILDVVRDIVSPWLGAPAGQNRQVTQAQGLARTAAQTLDQTFAGGMIGAGVKGNKALAKQAAVNVAALGTGYVAGKAMQTAAGAIAETGLPARIVNKVTGNMIGVHGSPVSGLTEIKPFLSRNAAKAGYTNPQVYAANPARGKSWQTAVDYSQLSGQGVTPPSSNSIGGSVYIVKGKIGPIKQEFKTDYLDAAVKLQKDVALKNKLTGSKTTTGAISKLKDFPIMVSGQPYKVVKEFPLKNDTSTFYNDLKRFGAKLPKKK